MKKIFVLICMISLEPAVFYENKEEVPADATALTVPVTVGFFPEKDAAERWLLVHLKKDGPRFEGRLKYASIAEGFNDKALIWEMAELIPKAIEVVHSDGSVVSTPYLLTEVIAKEVA